MLLVVRRSVFLDRERLREREGVAEIILALQIARGEGVRDARAPSKRIQVRAAIHLLELQRYGVVPGLHVVRRINHRCDSVRSPVKREVAAGSVGIQSAGGHLPCELVGAALSRVGESTSELPEQLSQADTELSRLRNLDVVVH